MNGRDALIHYLVGYLESMGTDCRARGMDLDEYIITMMKAIRCYCEAPNLFRDFLDKEESND